MSTRATLWQTTIREVLVPFLPPPITHSIRTLDNTLYPYVGPEATITILTTFLVAWFVLTILQVWISNRHGRAIKDDPNKRNDSETTLAEPFDATVLLTGPRNSGKTRLFYHLVYMEKNIPTVTSLKPNVGYVHSNNTIVNDDTMTTEQVIRYMDYPGYASVYEPNYISIIDPPKQKKKGRQHYVSSTPTRIVLVLDATQPVGAAAEILFQLFTILYDSYRTSMLSSSSSSQSTIDIPCIFVACHKKDFPKAKNEKRIKIQLRTELERLIYSAQTSSLTSSSTIQTSKTPAASTSKPTNNGSSINAVDKVGWWCCPPRNSQNSQNQQPSFTIAVDLDELAFVRLYFCATTCEEGQLSKELVAFCTSGSLPLSL